MVRPVALLHAQRPPVEPRPAATVLLLRDRPEGGGLEVLMTRRSRQASFAPGAYVFPGGTVDAADASAAGAGLVVRRPGQSDDQVRFAVAAIREAWEELGILLAHPQGGGDLASIAARLTREPDATRFFAAVRDAGLKLAVDRVWWYCHWITDRDLPRRFDTHFLVARMPPGQMPVADNREQFEPLWVSPAEALARHDRGEFEMIFPTIRTLRRMAREPDVDALLQQCTHERPLWVSSPRGGYRGGQVERFSEDESPFGELELTSPDGQVVHSLDWRNDVPTPLLRHVARLTAPNPGMMTGPGTNTYIVGVPETGFIVIDPGPALDAHIDRIHAVVGDRLQRILCTHSHPDHSPGAARLKRLTGATIAGLASRPTAQEHSRFTPDDEIADGERFVLRSPSAPATSAGRSSDSVETITLRAVHTPGHAANHVCFFLEEDRLLFSGDHVLNGSTTIVNPPDGDMTDYLASLARLAALDAAFILPAHGHVLGSPAAAIAALTAHRLKREAKVVAAVQALPGATLPELVRVAYDDTPEALHGIAQRSLLAHLDKLVRDAVLAADGDGWRIARAGPPEDGRAA